MNTEETLRAIREINENETDVLMAYVKNSVRIITNQSGKRFVIHVWIAAFVGFILKSIVYKMKKSMSKVWKSICVIDLAITFPIAFLITIFYKKIAIFVAYLIFSRKREEMVDNIENIRVYFRIRAQNLRRNPANVQEREARIVRY